MGSAPSRITGPPITCQRGRTELLARRDSRPLWWPVALGIHCMSKEFWRSSSGQDGILWNGLGRNVCGSSGNGDSRIPCHLVPCSTAPYVCRVGRRDLCSDCCGAWREPVSWRREMGFHPFHDPVCSYRHHGGSLGRGNAKERRQTSSIGRSARIRNGRNEQSRRACEPHSGIRLFSMEGTSGSSDVWMVSSDERGGHHVF